VISTTRELTQVVVEQQITRRAEPATPNGIGIEHGCGCYDGPACFAKPASQASDDFHQGIGDRNAFPVNRSHINGHDEAPQRNRGS
jgi:hypothetical protein